MIQFKSDHLNITPNESCRLTGMSDEQISIGIYNTLELNVVMFKDELDKIIIFSIDTLFISKELSNFVKEEIKKYNTGLSENNIILIASHTHYAPSLEEKRYALGRKDEAYFTYLKDKLSIFLFNFLSDEQFHELVQVELNILKSSKLTSNRRRKVRVFKDLFKLVVSMEPNLNGFKNEEIKVIKFYKNSELIPNLVFWSLPCHLTNLHVNNLISSEFPGLIREDIRNKMSNAKLNVLYFPGFAGDVRAYPPVRSFMKRKLRDVLKLSYPVNYYRFINEREYLSWYEKLNYQFWKTWNSNSVKKFVNEKVIEVKTCKLQIKELGIKSEYVEEIIFRKIMIGNLFSLLTISAEPVSIFNKIIENINQDDFNICTGYADEVFGYLPSNKYIEEGGYEAEGYFSNFLISGKFIKNIEEKVAEAISKLN